MLFLCFPGEARCRMMGTWEEGQKEKRMGGQIGEEDEWAGEGTGQAGEEDRHCWGGLREYLNKDWIGLELHFFVLFSDVNVKCSNLHGAKTEW